MPVGVQQKRTKGWRKPPDTVSVTRPGPYGVDSFERDWRDAIRSANTPPRSPYMPFGKPVYLGPLFGKNLMCWCGLDQPCHRNVLLKICAELSTAKD